MSGKKARAKRKQREAEDSFSWNKTIQGLYCKDEHPTKGQENGACNVTRCQREDSAIWYNHGSLAWYCTGCKEDIYDEWGYRQWRLDFPNKDHEMFETRTMIDLREGGK